MNRLENKVAIITGAAMGQGAAEAYLFAKEGAKVVATDMCEDILRETVQKINEDFSHSTIALKLNVTDEEEWKKVVEECINQFGTVDILLNNAGIGSKGINYDKTDYQAFENVMKINAWGPFVGMKTVAPIMIKNKKGSIINVSSLAAVKSIEFNAYSLSKGAVISLTKAASADLGKNGIRVNTIIPGTIETPMTKIICDYPLFFNTNNYRIISRIYFRTYSHHRINKKCTFVWICIWNRYFDYNIYFIYFCLRLFIKQY